LLFMDNLDHPQFFFLLCLSVSSQFYIPLHESEIWVGVRVCV
jgi:hypothetical protein